MPRFVQLLHAFVWSLGRMHLCFRLRHWKHAFSDRFGLIEPELFTEKTWFIFIPGKLEGWARGLGL